MYPLSDSRALSAEFHIRLFCGQQEYDLVHLENIQHLPEHILGRNGFRCRCTGINIDSNREKDFFLKRIRLLSHVG